MKAKIIVKDKGEILREVDVVKSSIFVGRGDECDLQLEDHAISKKNTRIFNKDGTWMVEDLNSTNGTMLDGIIINVEKLKDGSEIAVGNFVLIFKLPESGLDEEKTVSAASHQRTEHLQHKPAGGNMAGHALELDLDLDLEPEPAEEHAVFATAFTETSQKMPKKEDEESGKIIVKLKSDKKDKSSRYEIEEIEDVPASKAKTFIIVGLSVVIAGLIAFIVYHLLTR